MLFVLSRVIRSGGPKEFLSLQVSSPSYLLNHVAQRYSDTQRIVMEYVDNSIDAAGEIVREKFLFASSPCWQNQCLITHPIRTPSLSRSISMSTVTHVAWSFEIIASECHEMISFELFKMSGTLASEVNHFLTEDSDLEVPSPFQDITSLTYLLFSPCFQGRCQFHDHPNQQIPRILTWDFTSSWSKRRYFSSYPCSTNSRHGYWNRHRCVHTPGSIHCLMKF